MIVVLFACMEANTALYAKTPPQQQLPQALMASCVGT
jgi:hypothetical protein